MKKCNVIGCDVSSFGYTGYCREHIEEFMKDPTHPLYGAVVAGPALPKLVDYRRRIYEMEQKDANTAILTRYDSDESMVIDRRTAVIYEPTKPQKDEYIKYKHIYNENKAMTKPEVENTSFSDELAVLLTEMEELLRKKNKDYGSSYDNTVEELGEVVALVRLKDKYNRLKQLILSDEPAEVEESIEETLLDLVGYGIIELVRRRRQS